MSRAVAKPTSLRMMDYSSQDALRIGKSGKWGPYDFERNVFTAKQLRRSKKKAAKLRR